MPASTKRRMSSIAAARSYEAPCRSASCQLPLAMRETTNPGASVISSRAMPVVPDDTLPQHGPAADTVRMERAGLTRLPGAGRRSERSPLPPGLLLERRCELGQSPPLALSAWPCEPRTPDRDGPSGLGMLGTLHT